MSGMMAGTVVHSAQVATAMQAASVTSAVVATGSYAAATSGMTAAVMPATAAMPAATRHGHRWTGERNDHDDNCGHVHPGNV
jgi:hypothetical protein